jgi:hypothetical protein
MTGVEFTALQYPRNEGADHDCERRLRYVVSTD